MVPLIELAQGLPWLYLSLIFLFSLMVGSFLNVVIHRLPIMMERAWHAEYSDYFGDDEETPPATGRYNLMVPAPAAPLRPPPRGAGEHSPAELAMARGRCRNCHAPFRPAIPWSSCSPPCCRSR